MWLDVQTALNWSGRSAVWYLEWQWASAWGIWLWPNGSSSKKADMQIRRSWCNWHAWPKSRITRPDYGLRALQGRLREGSPGQLNCFFREGWHLDAGDMIVRDEYLNFWSKDNNEDCHRWHAAWLSEETRPVFYLVHQIISSCDRQIWWCDAKQQPHVLFWKSNSWLRTWGQETTLCSRIPHYLMRWTWFIKGRGGYRGHLSISTWMCRQ